MCRAKSDSGGERRCHGNHAASKQLTAEEWENLTEEQRLQLEEPIRMKYEATETARRERVSAAIAAKEARKAEVAEAKALKAAATAGSRRAKKLLTIDERTTVRVPLAEVPEGISDDALKTAVREAVKSEPYVGEEDAQALIARVNDERSTRDGADEEEEAVKIQPLFTPEDDFENRVRAGTFGLPLSLYLSRMVGNAFGKRHDLREGRETPSLTEGTIAQQLWLTVDEGERRKATEKFHGADTKLRRLNKVTGALNKADGRIAAIRSELESLNESQKAPHPDGGYGAERISLNELKLRKHSLTTEMQEIKNAKPALNAEYKTLAAQEQELRQRRADAIQNMTMLIHAAASMYDAVDRERYGRAFVGMMRYTASSYATHARQVQRKKASAAA